MATQRAFDNPIFMVRTSPGASATEGAADVQEKSYFVTQIDCISPALPIVRTVGAECKGACCKQADYLQAVGGVCHPRQTQKQSQVVVMDIFGSVKHLVPVA